MLCLKTNDHFTFLLVCRSQNLPIHSARNVHLKKCSYTSLRIVYHSVVMHTYICKSMTGRRSISHPSGRIGAQRRTMMAHVEAEPKVLFFAPTALRIYRHRDTAHGCLDLFVSSYEFLIPELTYVRHFGILLPYFENSCHGTNLAPR